MPDPSLLVPATSSTGTPAVASAGTAAVPSTGTAALPSTGAAARPSAGPGTQPRGFMDKVGDFFGDILKNFTGDNPSGTGLGAIVGTAGGGIIGYLIGGVPGALIGAGAGVAGGGLLNDLAVQVMEWVGIKTPPASRFAGGRAVVAQPDADLANRQGLNVNVPGATSPVVTNTIVPKDQNYRQLETVTAEYQQRYAGKTLGAALNTRLTEIQAMPPTRRGTEMTSLIADQDQVFQFMENTRRWNTLSTEWAAPGGDRERLVGANKAASAGLALPELAVPEALVFAPANNYATLPDRFVREVTTDAASRTAFLAKPPVQQLKDAYNNIDGKINAIDINGLIGPAKKSGDNIIGGRSAGRTAQAGAAWINNNLAFGYLGNSDDRTLAAGLHIGNAQDAVHAIARVTEASPDALNDAEKRAMLKMYADQGSRFAMKPEQRALFEAVQERARLEGIREDMNQHFGNLANDAQRGHNQLIRDNGFQNYTQSVETLRTGVDQRNQRVNELNQSQLRFVERSPAPAGPSAPPQTQAWVTIQDDSVTPPKLQTLVSEKRGEAWVVTNAYNGRHDPAKDTTSPVPPMVMPDIFTDRGVMSTNNIGQVLRQNLVQLRAGNPALAIGSAVTTPAAGVSTAPVPTTTVVTPPPATGPLPAPSGMVIE